VRPRKHASPKTGLKAVKLDMTRDQIQAFVSRMSGLMIITGSPGPGKTTVAFQRIRFLFDQQDQRESGGRLVKYAPELTRVFLANENSDGMRDCRDSFEVSQTPGRTSVYASNS
jgi:replicative DNA helicase